MMKTKIKSKFTNGVFQSLIFAAFLSFATACNNNGTNDRESITAEDTPEDQMAYTNDDTRSAEGEYAGFLTDAAEINMEEIELGKLAQQKGTLKDVKDMGKMMVTDHTKALEELKTLAAKKNVTLPAAPTEKMQKAKSDLSAKSGNDFDKAYSDKMVDGHKDAIQKFEKASKSDDPDIKAWAEAQLPALRTHLEHAQHCKDKADKM